MNQCVPSWDLPNHPNSPKDVPSLDYEVAELTWENGQLAMHGLGAPRPLNKPPASSGPPTWDKPRAGGTLESIVNQATFHPKPDDAKDLVPWFEHHRNPRGTVTMDALVPCTNDHRQQQPAAHVRDSFQAMGASRAGCSTRVGSCSGAAPPLDGGGVVRVGVNSCRTNGSVSVSESATCGGSREMTLDTWEREFPVTGLTSPEHTVSGQDHTKTTAAYDRDSISHRSRSHASDHRKAEGEEGKRRDKGKSSVSTKRSRAAAIHNQSERKRRDKINQRMKTLQKLVPNSSKSDKASMLDEVIEYLKQLQAQVHMMSRLNLPSMMLPLAMQQQLQMSMMGMGMGMAGMGMGIMDINTISRPPVAAFMPVPPASWDNPADSLPTPPPPPPAASVIPDPLAALLASCQSQPMTMDAYSRLAAMYQQLQQQQQPGSKT